MNIRTKQWVNLVLREIVHTILLITGVIVLGFTLIRLAPGDPALAIVGQQGGATQETLARIRETYRLNDPFYQQVFHYIGRVVTGDLGQSSYYHTPALGLVLDRLGNTLLLAGSAFILAVVFGTYLGVVSGRAPNSVRSKVVTLGSMAGFAAPVFWVGILLILIFSSWLPWFPTSGMRSIVPTSGFFGNTADILHHLTLPAVTLGGYYAAQYSRVGHTSVAETLESDYIRTARAKGVEPRALLFKHALRNAIIPLISLAGVQAARLLSGAILVETVFGWPGLGQLAVNSVGRRDTPVILAIFIISSVMVVLAMLLTDIAYQAADPRVRRRVRG